MDSNKSKNSKPQVQAPSTPDEKPLELQNRPSSPSIKPFGNSQPLEDMRAPLPLERRPNSHRPPIQRPLPVEEESAGTNWKKVGGLGLFTLILVKFAIHFMAGVAVTQGQVELSKYQAWSAEDKKEALDSCIDEAVKGLTQATLSNPMPQVRMAQISKSYCSCMIDKVEAAHIIRTKYNTLTESKSEAISQVKQSIDSYLATPEGKAALNNCFQAANAEADAGSEL